ncbi:hypothetical protein [Mangrovibacter phragmitis]|uniref:hypothetical protein n=1 Tax=Mangrovibacter phragmitis TaxID=1691903 RepID=UPI00336ADC5F
MKLFVANCSVQKRKFSYKIPEDNQHYFQDILPGHQICIEDSPEVVNHIVWQHEIYGLQESTKVDSNFSGICYSIDKPVSHSQIKHGHEQKKENMDDMSQKILEASAVTINNTISNEVLKTGEKPRDGLDLEIVGEAVNQEQENAPSTTKKVVKVSN